jgi:RHS repeat-associated protein
MLLSQALSCVLSVCLVAGSVGIPTAYAAPAKPQPVRREVVEKRTAFSKAYDNGDGTYTYEAYPNPVHFRDEASGRYLPVDSSLEETGPATGRRWRNRANAFDVSLPANLGQSGWVSIETSRGAVSMRPITGRGVNAASVAADSAAQKTPTSGTDVRYSQAYTGADVAYQSTARGLKETISLPSWSGKSTFSFALRTKGLRPEIDADGGIACYSTESSSPVFVSPPPWMMDSAGGTDDGAYSTAVRYELVQDKLDWRLDVVADPLWLADPARVYPVRIDPTFYYDWGAYTYDTYVASGHPTTNYGTSTILRTGHWDESTMEVTHILVRPYIDADGFITGDQAANFDVLDANLKMYCYGTYTGQDVGVQVADLDEVWTELGATWNTAPAWGAHTHATVSHGWNNFAITDIVDRWVSGEHPEYGLMVYSGDVANAAKFYSNENASSWPSFVVHYAVRPSFTLIDPGPDVAVSGRPTLRWDFSDLDGKTQTKAEFEIQKSGTTGNLWSSGTVNLTAAQNSLEITDTALSLEPGRYYVRMRGAAIVPGKEDAWSLWTEWRAFDYATLNGASDQLGVLAYHASDDLGGGARVDLSNGRLQIARSDFAGPGTGGPLGFSLRYDSATTSDVGFGAGWRLALPSMIPSDQIAPNPGFESGPDANGRPTGWTPWGTASISRDTAQAHTGAASVKFYSSASTSAWVSDASSPTSSRLTVPGQRYDVSYWVKTSGMTVTGSTERGVCARLVYYDEGGTNIGMSLAEGCIISTTSGWVKRTLAGVAPEKARRARLVIDFKNAKGTAWVDDVEYHDGTQVLTSASGTTRTLRQAGGGTYTRDPLEPGLALETVNAALGARVSSNATVSITGVSVDGVSTGAATGNAGVDSCSWAADGTHYIQYDLKRPRVIDTARVYLWDGEESPARSYSYFMQINETGNPLDWEDAGSSFSNPVVGSGWTTATFEPVRARSVRVCAINNTFNANFHICEFELPVFDLNDSPVSFDASGTLAAVADESNNLISYRHESGRVAAVEERTSTDTTRGVDLEWGTTRLEHLDWRGIDSKGVVANTEHGVVSYEFNDTAHTSTVSQPGTSTPIHSAVFGYDTSGRITSVTDADGQTTTIEYASNKVSRVVRGPSGLQVTTAYTYGGTADEPVVTIVTSGQDGTSLTRRVKMSAALGYQVTESTLDPSGADLTTTYAYDLYGHIRSVAAPAGTDSFDLDSHGNAWKRTEKGARETTATYADDRVMTSTDVLGNVMSTRVSDEASSGVYTAATDYDEWGNKIIGGSGGSASLNLVLNGTFAEDPTALGWTSASPHGLSWAATATLPFVQPYLGSHVARLTGDAAGAYMMSDAFTVSAGATYTAEAWAAGTGLIRVISFDASMAQISDAVVARSVSGELTSSSRLQRASGTWVVPAGALAAVLVLSTDPSETAVFDNVRFEKASAAGDDDFVDNGSVEAGSETSATNWRPKAAGSDTASVQKRVDKKTIPAVSGSYSLMVTGDGVKWGAFYSDWIAVEPGEDYTFGGYMAVSGYKDSGNPAILLQEADSSQTFIPSSPSRPYPSATPSALKGNQPWRRFTGTYKVKPDVHYVRLYPRALLVNGSVFWDALFLRPAVTQTTHEFDATTHSFEVTQTTNTGRVLTSYYDARGRQREATFRASATSTTSTVLSANGYDAAGRLSSVGIRATTNTTISASFTYTRAGRLSTVTNPRGGISRIGYDALGRVSSVTAPSGTASMLSYDSLSRLKDVFRPGSGTSVRLAENAYDSAGRPRTTAYFNAQNATATVATMRYDSASRVSTLTLTGETAGSVANTYDALSRVTGVTLAGPGGTASASTVYDKGDRPLSTSWSALGTTGTVSGTYALTGEWLSASSFGRSYSFAWSASGGLESVISDKAVTNIADDAFGRTASVRTGYAGPTGAFGPYASYDLAYDDRDRLSGIAAIRQGSASTEAFGYDLAGRLTSWTRDGAQTSYGFDLSGNLTSVNAGGTQTTLAYNVDDQLTSSTAGSLVTTFGNDVLGRRTSKRSAASTTTTTYGYDAMGHLTSFRSPDASATYSYGATGMREVKVVSRGSVTTTVSTLWSAGKPVVERDGDGTTLRYLYGPGGLPLSLQVTRAGATNTYHYLTDALGSVAALVSETGTVAASYAYDPWGRVTSVGGADAWLASRQPLRYRAYYFDAESGLYYLPLRFYDPESCRFLTPDPDSPSAGNPMSLNRYVYCEDDPIGMSDPSGADPPDKGVNKRYSKEWREWKKHLRRLWAGWRRAEKESQRQSRDYRADERAGVVRYQVVVTPAWGLPFGLNHVYVRSTRSGWIKGMNGAEGVYCVPWPVSKGDGGGPVDTFPNPVNVPDSMSDQEFETRISEWDGWGRGGYALFTNDCHNQLAGAFEGAGVDYPGAPNGRVDWDELVGQ